MNLELASAKDTKRKENIIYKRVVVGGLNKDIINTHRRYEDAVESIRHERDARGEARSRERHDEAVDAEHEGRDACDRSADTKDRDGGEQDKERDQEVLVKRERTMQ